MTHNQTFLVLALIICSNVVLADDPDVPLPLPVNFHSQSVTLIPMKISLFFNDTSPENLDQFCLPQGPITVTANHELLRKDMMASLTFSGDFGPGKHCSKRLTITTVGNMQYAIPRMNDDLKDILLITTNVLLVVPFIAKASLNPDDGLEFAFALVPYKYNQEDTFYAGILGYFVKEFTSQSVIDRMENDSFNLDSNFIKEMKDTAKLSLQQD